MCVVFALGGWCRTSLPVDLDSHRRALAHARLLPCVAQACGRLNTLTLSLRTVVLRVLRQDGKGTDAEDAVVQDFIKRTCQVEEELLGEPTRAPCSNRVATACFYTRHQCAHPVYTMAKSW